MTEDPKARGPSAVTSVVLLVALGLLVAFVLSWSGGEPRPAESPFALGKRLYETKCTICHHPDPAREYGTQGTFGPPLAGSSFELIKMRVLSTAYPAGYQPKRDTQLMTTLDLDMDQLRALHTYIEHYATGDPAAPKAPKDPKDPKDPGAERAR